MKNVKEYLSKAGGFINRLPFVNLAEKHLGKVSALKKVIPYANYIACGAAVLIVFAVVSGIVAPGMKFNKWIKGIEGAYEEQTSNYQSVDFMGEYSKALDEAVSQMNECSDDRKGLEELRENKKDYLGRLSDVRDRLEKMSNEFTDKFSAKMNAVGNPSFKMSNKMIKEYQDKLAKLVPASSDLMENYFTINSKTYDDFCDKFEEKYAEKLNKISDAIKEADRQAYFSYLKRTLPGKWRFDDNKDDRKGFAELVFKGDGASGEFSYYYHKDFGTEVEINPMDLWSYYINEFGQPRVGKLIELPEEEFKYSGTYTMPENTAYLKINSASSKNTPEKKAGESLQSRVSFEDSNTLYFDGKMFKRARR
mgnify:FL=1